MSKMIDSYALKDAIDDINLSMRALDSKIISKKSIIEERLADLTKTEELLKSMTDALSNDPNDPYLESPQLEEAEENLDSVREEIDNLTDILDALNIDVSPLLIYSSTKMSDNDDIIEATLPNS